MNIVLDNNVLISALWSDNSKPAVIINAVLSRNFTVCYDYRILNEYYHILRHPKFAFTEWEIQSLLSAITTNGISVVADYLPNIPFTNESSKNFGKNFCKKFYEVAKFCNAILITESKKDFPQDSCVITVADFHKKYFD